MEQEVGRSIDPNITSGMGNGRYPNPFFDLAQQYMPPTIKELFKWCTFYYYSSPLIGSAVKKVSRYPITDLIFESEHDSTRTAWSRIFNDTLRIKDRLMEINLDYHVYGNCFVSIHLPFTRFLICPTCRKRHTIGSIEWRFSAGTDFFSGVCSCGYSGKMGVKDVPYKDPKGVKIIRWNPRNISIKYNEFTGRYVYMYAVPHAIRKAIHRGDKDVVQDMPLVALEAVTKRRLIRLNNDNLFHLKNPTLAEQDQGWGKPAIVHILREMFYYFILRRAQEAVAQEHIVPFDIIYPTPNGGMDPYMHTDLGNWRNQIETVIQKHRKDPNYKAVIPVPVGFGRLGGDGKALLLGPEIAHLTQTTVGGMGIPQEFLFGGLNYTGSSISLRTLENDFVQNRSQLLDFTLWLKNKLRTWLSLPDLKSIRMADFRMADDVQRNQQLIGLNAQGKVSNQTLLTELGYDHEEETKKMIEEAFLQNYMQDLMSKGSAKSQGEASIIGYNYQQKLQEMAEKAQEEAQKKIDQQNAMAGPVTDNVGTPTPEDMGDRSQVMQSMAGGMQPGMSAPAPVEQDPAGGALVESGDVSSEVSQNINERVERWATQLTKMDPTQARNTLAEIKNKTPDLGKLVEKAYNNKMGGSLLEQAPVVTPGGEQVAGDELIDTSMKPLPEGRAPTRGEQTGGG